MSLLKSQIERSLLNFESKTRLEFTDFLDVQTVTTNPDVTTNSARGPDVAKAPFVAGEAKQLLILAYQRTGSTFFGKIFDWDPQALTPPDYEVTAVQSALQGLFTCKPQTLPVEMITHPFYGQFLLKSTRNYSRCLVRHNLFPQCGEKLHSRCLRRFGADENAMSMCHFHIARLNTTAAGVLWYAATHGISSENDPELTTTPAGDAKSRSTRKRRRRRPPDRVVNDPIDETEFHFNDYVKCLSEKAAELLDCYPVFISGCSSSNLRVVKVVRGDMRAVDALMRASRNFRLVHLIRDPRGVTSSRRRLPFFHSIGVKASNMVPEAAYYCEDVIRDIRFRRELETRYPGRILQVIYDEFVTNAHENVRRIYKFLERPLPAEVVAFVNETKPSTATSWNTKLNGTQVENIDNVCKELYEILSEDEDTFNFPMR
ncbi:hypothetical protein NP493_3422g00001 [Ridgeia piscesae]|uniref:Sulfotransferase n=1 Tax=Ridgeia piscesae TaxID=27915 RepID=A0AAD9MVR2_RIDPI|nr:hypothetical protein NP493_3422g00001 [Ridgeia piscesae]